MYKNLLDIQFEALQEMHHYGLKDWEFRFLPKKTLKVLGQCWFETKTITLSLPFAQTFMDEPAIIMDVIRHEIAHALAWTKEGHYKHGEPWKRYCELVGAKPNRLKDLSKRK